MGKIAILVLAIIGMIATSEANPVSGDVSRMKEPIKVSVNIDHHYFNILISKNMNFVSFFQTMKKVNVNVNVGPGTKYTGDQSLGTIVAMYTIVPSQLHLGRCWSQQLTGHYQKIMAGKLSAQ